jgi:hypothetical protein
MRIEPARRTMTAANLSSDLGVDAVLFDLDGVVTRTARLHAAAWKTLFDDCLRRQAEERNVTFVAFDAEADYLAYVDSDCARACAWTSSRRILASTRRSAEVRNEVRSVTFRLRSRHEPVPGHRVHAVRGIRPPFPPDGHVPQLASPASRVHVDQLVELPPRPCRELRLWLVHLLDLGTPVQRVQRTRGAMGMRAW